MRIVIGDDAALMREALSKLLEDLGHAVVATARTGDELVAACAAHRPDAVIADIRMPPSFVDEGIVAAQRIRADRPGTAVLILSNHLHLRYATELLGDMPEGVGYLLKERVAAAGALTDALERLCQGECVVDPSIVSRVMGRRAGGPTVSSLSERESAVLQLMAEGRSNRGIAAELHVNERTVEGHVGNIFMKLQIDDVERDNRRVVAVLRWLRA